MNFSRIINNEICYHSKEVYNIYEMFHTRYSMHKQVNFEGKLNGTGVQS
jgi:HD superfamily phosphohydrolase